ncbi:MAG: hypothetical protein JST42_03835, partial [Bacteroidetes bacterium]|nr:hypothetical protein [Bacteroidota bacterium]
MNPDLKNLIEKYLQDSLTREEAAGLQRMLEDRVHQDSLEEMVMSRLRMPLEGEGDEFVGGEDRGDEGEGSDGGKEGEGSNEGDEGEEGDAGDEDEESNEGHEGDEGEESLRSRILAGLDEKIDVYESGRDVAVVALKRGMAGRWRMLAAASVLVVVLAGAWFHYRGEGGGHSGPVVRSAPAKKVVPGSNKAILTLADGSEIQLDDSKGVELAEQGGIKVVKMGNGVIAYNGKNAGGAHMFNTIRTPRGGQYEVVLPDGSHAWLNSASSL